LSGAAAGGTCKAIEAVEKPLLRSWFDRLTTSGEAQAHHERRCVGTSNRSP
jgi:hypothetical protein